MQIAVERRPTLLLIIVLGVLFLLMSTSTRTRVVGETRTLFERTVMSTFSFVPRSVNWAGQNVADAYHGYLDMRRAVAENIRLRNKVADLTRENLELRQSSDDLGRLRGLLGYSEQLTLKTSLARIVMLDTAGRFKSMILDRGSDDAVEINDSVVNASGLIGRVVLTTDELAKIQLITDTNSAVGCRIERTRREGVIRGDGQGALNLLYIPGLSDVVKGDRIVTSGTDGIYPAGIPVATVLEVSEGTDLFKNIRCAPLVDMSRLEDVLILHTRKIPSEVVRYTP